LAAAAIVAHVSNAEIARLCEVLIFDAIILPIYADLRQTTLQVLA
jgi:hypothetical protein